jgi:hypothetical protein
MTGSDEKAEPRITAPAVAGSALITAAALAEGPLAIAASILGGVLMFAPASRNGGQPPSSWPEDDATSPPAAQPTISRQPATPSPAERWIDRATEAQAVRRGRDR